MSDVRRCWAIHPEYGRCTLDYDHNSNHEVRNLWGDEESADVEELLALAQSAVAQGLDAPYNVPQPPAPSTQTTETEFVMGCAACGCSLDAHDVDLGDETGCVKHQCRRYV
jgi:hypothetical protein